MGVTAINSHDEFTKIINSNPGKTVVIDFWASWCGPCRMISPIFEKNSESDDFKDIEFYKVDVDAQDQISQEVGIRVMPTFMVFKNGEKVDELTGANPPGLHTLLTKAAA